MYAGKTKAKVWWRDTIHAEEWKMNNLMLSIEKPMPKNEKSDVMRWKLMQKTKKYNMMQGKTHAKEWKVWCDAVKNSCRRMKNLMRCREKLMAKNEKSAMMQDKILCRGMKSLIWCRKNLMMKNEKIKYRIKENICLEFTVHDELNKILQNFVLAHLIVLSPSFFLPVLSRIAVIQWRECYYLNKI